MVWVPLVTSKLLLIVASLKFPFPAWVPLMTMVPTAPEEVIVQVPLEQLMVAGLLLPREIVTVKPDVDEAVIPSGVARKVESG